MLTPPAPRLPFPPTPLPRAQAERIKHLLDNVEGGSGKGSVLEKMEGMKYLLAVRVMGGWGWAWEVGRSGVECMGGVMEKKSAHLVVATPTTSAAPTTSSHPLFSSYFFTTTPLSTPRTRHPTSAANGARARRV